ncbi:hypothetical protein CC86DRAFT_285737 [Ophiobolus disseminans]|uniref:Uncharacterized protein n=1 Tax=Ophiobolus disseminans TaxID=1469910 RepID=A0A6A7AA97_9PLEO|nr:hypothetical protein CC86DRAFT_285737 [Ophiobolus disseminans]
MVLVCVTAAPSGPSNSPSNPPSFYTRNLCRFPVYVNSVVAWGPGSRPGERCPDFGETRQRILNPGHSLQSLFPIRQDSCGHSIKVARVPGGRVYQFEFNWARENNKMWYNLSSIDGNPFTDVSREISGPLSCPKLHCFPGNNGSACDYPVQTDCLTVGNMFGWLCAGDPGSIPWTNEMMSTAQTIDELPFVED